MVSRRRLALTMPELADRDSASGEPTPGPTSARPAQYTVLDRLWVPSLRLRETHLPGAGVHRRVRAANGELAEAIRAAEESLAVEPFTKMTYQREPAT